MTEIFTNISSQLKDQAAFIFEMAMRQKNIVQAINVLDDFTRLHEDEAEREFIEFYFNSRMEQLHNENNNDKR